MRLIARLFVFASSLFIVLYGVLPGYFKLEGNFVSMFVAGHDFLGGVNPVLFYRFPYFQRLIDESGLTAGLNTHVFSPPSWIIPEAILGIFPPLIARFLFTSVSLVAFLLLVHATSKVAGTGVKATYLVFLSTSFALATNFQLGEPYLILTFLFVLIFYVFSQNRLAACGGLLGLGFPFNPFFGIVSALFLLSAKWRTFWYFLVIAAATLLLSYMLVGHSAVTYYAQRILPAYLDGRTLNPFSDYHQTAWSVLRRLLVYNQTLNPHPLIDSTLAYQILSAVFKAFVVVPAAYFFYKGVSSHKAGDVLAAASFAIILLSPAATAPQMIILAPAIVVVSQSALDDGRRKTAAAIVTLYALACLPTPAPLLEKIGVHNLFLEYDRFLILVALYAIYLYRQSRIVPPAQRLMRAVLTSVVAGAVAVTVFAGDRLYDSDQQLPIHPALSAEAYAGLSFSPAMRDSKLNYITFDSTSENLILSGAPAPLATGKNIYRFSSDEDGDNFAYEEVDNGTPKAVFHTGGVRLSFNGRNVSVSQNGDYGAYMRNGIAYVLDLDARSISPVDTISLLPYRIGRCSFNAGRNFELVFLVDSLNSSYALGTYDLYTRTFTTHKLPFRPELICSYRDDYFLTEETADTTKIWSLVGRNDWKPLLFVRGNVYDITVLNGSLYLSSDFGRGLDYPTIYKYSATDSAAAGHRLMARGTKP